MNPCSCGRAVALRAARITFMRRRGVAHWIEHQDGSKLCRPGVWTCVAFKPYAREQAQRPYAVLIQQWDAEAARG